MSAPHKTDDVDGIPTNHLARLNPFKPDDQGGEEQGEPIHFILMPRLPNLHPILYHTQVRK